MSEDDSVKHEGKWTRADLPSWVKIRDADDMAGNGLRSRVIDIALNEVVYHLNAHHHKPAPDLLSSAAECVLDAEDRVKAAKRERDEAQMERTDALRERDAAVARADQLRDERDDAVQSCMAVGRERDAARKALEDERIVNESMTTSLIEVSSQRDKAQDQWKKWEHKANEWKARAEEAEADREKIAEEFADFRVDVIAEAVKYRESHPPISRADIDKALEDRMMEGWNYRSDLVDAVCRLFGIEAEPTVDPSEAKARELWEVGRGMSVRIEFDDIAPDHRGEYLRIARHLIDKEEGDG